LHGASVVSKAWTFLSGFEEAAVKPRPTLTMRIVVVATIIVLYLVTLLEVVFRVPLSPPVAHE